MCNCREVLKKAELWQLKGEQPTYVDIPLGFSRVGNQLVGLTFTEVKLTYQSKKRPVIEPVYHSYCPFCGESYKPLDESPLSEDTSIVTLLGQEKALLIHLLTKEINQIETGLKLAKEAGDHESAAYERRVIQRELLFHTLQKLNNNLQKGGECND